ncbi:MAG: aminotransferase [Planctomycetota bacterium]|nr:MAG: aminotransferase [Planctomycetota bacterium]
MTATRLAPFGTSIFAEMTRLALENQAINLSQGYPDFEGPAPVIERAAEEFRKGQNQYARTMGDPELVSAIAETLLEDQGRVLDPMTDVVVTSGATEGLAASLLGLLNPGDSVVVFEPYYDSYHAGTVLAGAQLRTVPLRHPDFEVDLEALEAALQGARLLLLNTPHNPSGKVFTRSELEDIASLCQQHDVTVLTDEVYEHLAFDGREHISIATLPGMHERSLVVSSAGKTFSFTGWKIGWVTGPKELVAATQAAHQFLTFTVNTPVQRTMAWTLREYREPYFRELRHRFEERRKLLIQELTSCGFEAAPAQGGYFLLTRFAKHSDKSGAEFARELITKHGVAALPVDSFYLSDKSEGHALIRFAFCKSRETILAAGKRLRALRA